MDPTQPGGHPPPPQPPPWPPPVPTGWGPPAGGPPPRTPPGSRAGRVLAVLAATVAVGLAAIIVLRPDVGVDRPAGSAAPRRPTATVPPDPSGEALRLLARRAAAIVHRDRAAFLATVDRRHAAYYRAQASLFTRLRTVPFSSFSYRLTEARDLATQRVRRRYAPDRVYLPRVEARYRFRGQDASPVLARYFYTFVQTRSGWRIGGQGDARPAGRDDVEIWDAGAVRTMRTARTLVVHHPGDEPLAGRLLQVAERAYGQVAAAWTARWERKVVILVPHDEPEAERLVGVRDLRQVAAVAASSVEAGPVERVLGNRIVVNSTNVARYDSLNLQILLTHEMTHVATRTLGDGVPLLLVEGFADYAALRPLALPLTVTRPALAERVRSGRFDGTLPADRDFRGATAAVAYDEASSFCLWAAQTFGERRLRELYRAFAGSSPPSGAELDRGFRRVLGVSRRAAEARWAAWVRERL